MSVAIIQDRKDATAAVQKQFIKENSLVKLLTFQHLKPGKQTRNIKVKIEVDTNPPTHSITEIKYHDFPFPYEVVTQDLPSLFAGKSHAVLCREYVKGRDWYQRFIKPHELPSIQIWSADFFLDRLNKLATFL